MANPHPEPLVCVGMPVYNRLPGLIKTLTNIRNQTHRNLQIIVSDNCSPNPEIPAYLAEVAREDARVLVVRQRRNIGAYNNFLYLLRTATAEYFMWAADDDEHEPQFIEKCLEIMRLHGPRVSTAMTQMEVVNRSKRTRGPAVLPPLDPAQSPAENLRAYYSWVSPSLIYGLHRTEAIRWFQAFPIFDWCDCYFTARQLLDGHTIAIVPEFVGYTAGIDKSDYELKPQSDGSTRGLRYRPFLSAIVSRTFTSGSVGAIDKLELTLRAVQFLLANYAKWQRSANPLMCAVAQRVIAATIRILTPRRPRKRNG